MENQWHVSQVNTNHKLPSIGTLFRIPNEKLAHPWKMYGLSEEKILDYEIHNHFPYLPLTYFKSLLHLCDIFSPNIYNICTFSPRVSIICKMGPELEKWVSPGYICAHVNMPPFLVCSLGPKPCWMMGNRESKEKIKGKQSLKSLWWTRCLSNPPAYM